MTYFIYFHAALGAVALLTGSLAILARKGSTAHRKGGKIFLVSMLTSAVASLIICLSPGHENTFLLGIAILSIYLLLSGYRSLSFKNRDHQFWIDRMLAALITLTGIYMLIYPLLAFQEFKVLYTAFGSAALIFGVRDLRILRHPEQARKNWLKGHLGKMMGGYISAFTAFLVVNGFFPLLINWFLPSVLGGVYIAYWMLKLKKKAKPQS